MTIYFVDEDWAKLDAWIVELEYRGFEVRPVGDADRALNVLRTANDIQCTIIDVMLAATEQPTSRFPEERTEQGLITGLTLLRDLCLIRPDAFPSRAHLLTAATNNEPYLAALACANDLGVSLTLKTDMNSPREFGDRIEHLLSTQAGDQE